MIAYNQLKLINQPKPVNKPKLIKVRAHTRWRLGKREHVTEHWRFVYK